MRRLIRKARNNAASGFDAMSDLTERTAETAILGPGGKAAGKLIAAPNRILARIARGKVKK